MSISPENQKLLDEVLASGRFKTHDEAHEEALRLLKEQQAETNGGYIHCKKVRLAKGRQNRKLAQQKFYELMAIHESPDTDDLLVADLMEAFLT